jgi:hypothetical protein
LQDLDQRSFQTWNLKTVFDATNEADGVDLGTDVLEKRADEACLE